MSRTDDFELEAAASPGFYIQIGEFADFVVAEPLAEVRGQWDAAARASHFVDLGC